MTNVSPRSFDPDVIARVSTLEFRTRAIVEGLISGKHRSPFRGGTADFAQHRPYAAGDDLRWLDWKAWAKSDKLYVKEFEDETNLRATLLLDASASMNYGDGESNKYSYATLLAGSLSYLLLRQSDAVGLLVFDDALRAEVPHRNQSNHLRAILHATHIVKPAHKLDITKTLSQLIDREPKRGLVVIISDLLAERQSVINALRQLRRRRHDVLVFHVLHDDELDFPFNGPTRFEGMESEVTLTCDPRALREDFVRAMQDYINELGRECSRASIDYRLCRTSKPVDSVLAELLHERMRG